MSILNGILRVFACALIAGLERRDFEIALQHFFPFLDELHEKVVSLHKPGHTEGQTLVYLPEVIPAIKAAGGTDVVVTRVGQIVP